jgi:hypothetical protein
MVGSDTKWHSHRSPNETAHNCHKKCHSDLRWLKHLGANHRVDSPLSVF